MREMRYDNVLATFPHGSGVPEDATPDGDHVTGPKGHMKVQLGKLQNHGGVVAESRQDHPAEGRILDVRMFSADLVEQDLPALVNQGVNGAHCHLRCQGVAHYSAQFLSISEVGVICGVEECVDVVGDDAQVQQQVC